MEMIRRWDVKRKLRVFKHVTCIKKTKKIRRKKSNLQQILMRRFRASASLPLRENLLALRDVRKLQEKIEVVRLLAVQSHNLIIRHIK